MRDYLLRRLLLIFPVIIGVSLLVFLLIHLIPGDPAVLILGDSAQSSDIEKLRHDLGLDRPMHLQLTSFIWGLLHLDLGESLHKKRPVSEIIKERFPATIQLALASLLIAVIIAFPLGILSAVKSHTPIDTGASFFALLGVSIPHFWLGPLLILVFSIHLRLLPISGKTDFYSFILPAVTMGTSLAAFLTRMIRSSLLDVIRAPYISTARAKGLHPFRVITKHALRNALIPVVTILGLQLGALLGGSIITETIFSWPGIGRELIQAIQGRDYPVVQGCVFIIALSYVLINLMTDLIYAAIDPRIQLGKKEAISNSSEIVSRIGNYTQTAWRLGIVAIMSIVAWTNWNLIRQTLSDIGMWISAVFLTSTSALILAKIGMLLLPIWGLYRWFRIDRPRFLKFIKRIPAVMGVVIFLSFLLTGLFGKDLFHYDPMVQDLSQRLMSPGPNHWMGTDDFGRDMSGRMVHGAFISMYVGLTTTLLCAMSGVIIGIISALKGGWVDELIMRLIDILLAFPGILLAIAFVAVLGPSIHNVIIALSIMGWVGYARLARAQVLSIREEEYVAAARITGVSNRRLIFSHLLPNIMAPLIVQATLGMASVIVAEAGLSFLGLGVQPPTPSWGSILNSGIDFFRRAPHMTLIPGAAIMVVVMGLNFLGDALRDALDPKMIN